ncbi:MAG: hypothetical protein IT186_15975 [Acidobacteria bacterium]|nr:hypothetical protein [Acidobacteriota bacterium]
MSRSPKHPPAPPLFPAMETPPAESTPRTNQGGRPPGRTYDSTFLIRIEAEKLEAARQAAEERGETLGEWIRLAIVNRLRIQHRIKTRDEDRD